ncbi:MAG: transketolase-like TK C-terminal-containing protein, partial [Vicinamibacterales bacterium]
LEGLRQCCDRENGLSSYLRLSTTPIDQALFQPALDRLGQEELRRRVLAGGYRIVDAPTVAPEADANDTVIIATAGVMVPEAIAAARLLHAEGVAATVLNLTSPQRLFQEWQARQRWLMGLENGARPAIHLDEIIHEGERRAPIVTVQDGASHALAWLGSVYGAPSVSLGVDEFGQSGTRHDLYRHYGIDAEHIASAAFAMLDRRDGIVM